MSDEVYILGVGAQTAVGRTVAATAAAVRAGLSAATDHPLRVDRHREPMVVCRASWLPIELSGVERSLSLAMNAAREALAALPDAPNLRPIPVFLGLPEARPGSPKGLDMALSTGVAARLRPHTRISEVMSLPAGHASGLMALAEAQARILGGHADVCLVGGVESYLESETLEWIEDSQQLHARSNSWGFTPGEAAGFCLLASSRVAAALGGRAPARLLGVATAYEENRIKTETVCLARGLTQALGRVLDVLPASTQVDQVICDLNGERYRANELAFSMVRMARRFAAPGEFLAPADCWGDVGAASGPLFVALAVEAGRRGYARGPCQLLWASSEGGLRAAALIEVEVARSAFQ